MVASQKRVHQHGVLEVQLAALKDGVEDRKKSTGEGPIMVMNPVVHERVKARITKQSRKIKTRPTGAANQGSYKGEATCKACWQCRRKANRSTLR